MRDVNRRTMVIGALIGLGAGVAMAVVAGVQGPSAQRSKSHPAAARQVPGDAGPDLPNPDLFSPDVPSPAPGTAGPASEGGPVAVASAFAEAEWSSDGTGGLHAMAGRTAPWASARLRSAWAAASDPPAPPGPAAVGRILDATIVDPRAATIVVQIDVERFWSAGPSPTVDPVPHLLLLTMAYDNGGWTVDDVAAIN
jgi:hypothetical protein